MRRQVASVALALVVASVAAAKTPKPAACPLGPFAVEGEALVAGVPASADVVVLGGGGVALGADCFASAKTKATRAFTRVRARFGSCGGFRSAKLVAKISSPDCDEMVGKLKTRGAPAREFRAVRIRCGDGRFDPAGEACDAGTGCDPGEECTTDCECLTTTTTTSSTSSSSTDAPGETTTTSSTAPPPTLNFSLPPVFGSTALTSGFVPDPFSVGVTAGGPANVSYLGGGCVGFTTSAPSFSVNYTSGAFPLLRFYFVAALGPVVLNPADTTMIINTPTGSFVCVNDSFGTVHPTIDFNIPPSGRYDVWVGARAAGRSPAGTLFVTENSANRPPADPVIGPPTR